MKYYADEEAKKNALIDEAATEEPAQEPDEEKLQAMKTAKTQIIVIFVIRVMLWITALVSTVYWIRFSFKLTMDGIFAPEEYAPILRPVLYRCVIIAVVAIAISFALYALSKHIKKQNDIP